MYKFCIIFAVVVAFAYGKEEPFSIGLGVLSPSYSQTVGKENVKVNFEQRDNGQFAYSVGDPKSGSNTYLNFGGPASSQPVNPSGFSDASPNAAPNPSSYAAPNPSSYAAPSPSAYGGSGVGSVGYGASGLGSSGYGAGVGSPSGYAGSGLGSSGYTGSGLGSPSGYAPPQEGAYTGFAGYQAPSYGASSGLGASGFGSGSYGGSSGFGSLNAYGGSSGYGGQAAAPISPSAYSPESARKPEENSAQILPAGFSYHGTEGQAFLRQGDSPNFVIAQEPKESARGIAEQSFFDTFKVSGASQGSGKFLQNGLVGYGPGGPQGNVPVGGYAGPQHAGLVREHGGHA